MVVFAFRVLMGFYRAFAGGLFPSVVFFLRITLFSLRMVFSRHWLRVSLVAFTLVGFSSAWGNFLYALS